MKIAAVIAEYNPFHNGHLYQLCTIRKELDADCIIVVLGGDFMQRGIPALVDKYTRCDMALAHGADLVLELPIYYSLGSAEYFAKGAVALLDHLDVVDILHFGSETGDIDILMRIAEALAHESPSYQAALRQYQREGCSFAAARGKALAQELGTDVSAIVSQPNNTLGIEYCKALLQRDSRIRPITLQRRGSNYNDNSLSDSALSSAGAIREAIQTDGCTASVANAVANAMPSDVYAMLAKSEYLFADDFSSMLYYKLMNETDLTRYYDVNRSLADTFFKHLGEYVSFSQYAPACKSKNITYSHISRALMHVLLGMTVETAAQLTASDYAHYAHVLGFTEKGKALLHQMKANSDLPIITKLPDALRTLDGTALASLRADVHATQLYYGVQGIKYGHAPRNEMTVKRF